MSGGNVVLLDLRLNSNSLLFGSVLKVVLKSLLQNFNSSGVVISLRNLQGLIIVFHLSLDSLELLELAHIAAHHDNKGNWNKHAVWRWMVSHLLMVFSLKVH